MGSLLTPICTLHSVVLLTKSYNEFFCPFWYIQRRLTANYISWKKNPPNKKPWNIDHHHCWLSKLDIWSSQLRLIWLTVYMIALFFYKIDQSKTCFAFKFYWSSTLISYLTLALRILFIRITAICCVWSTIMWIHQKFYNLHFLYSALCEVGNGSHAAPVT